MKLTILISILSFCCLEVSVCAPGNKQTQLPPKAVISKEVLLDKIKGGWAGKVIGCTYGGPVEFAYNGTMIQDYIPLNWPDGKIRHYYDTWPGLYDDIYVNLTFVDVFERLGLDAPVDSFALAFAHAEYPLWHANQAARYNILQGIMPPASGHWLNNPHADDIDFQIEADFAGLMAPGMPNTASGISDKIGHIMNYGDGWYGGVFVAAMYSLAFVSDDIEFIVSEALKTIPPQSTFYQCINDVINWHKKYPEDWKQNWFECERKWSEDMGCPDGVFVPFNIDAKINSAYVVIGLLYGQGHFTKTIDIATRCGQDADCNPATAVGILGTMHGYSHIPEYWKKNIYEVEDRDFAYTSISLNKTYAMSFNQALQLIGKNGGKVDEKQVSIACQQPVPVKMEKAFGGHFPSLKIPVYKSLKDTLTIQFEGVGFALKGNVKCTEVDYVARVELYVDDNLTETINLPASEVTRRHEICWKYQLANKKHTIKLNWLNPRGDASINLGELVCYDDKYRKK